MKSSHSKLCTQAPGRPPCEDLGPRLWDKVQPLSDTVGSQLFLKNDGEGEKEGREGGEVRGWNACFCGILGSSPCAAGQSEGWTADSS